MTSGEIADDAKKELTQLFNASAGTMRYEKCRYALNQAQHPSIKKSLDEMQSKHPDVFVKHAIAQAPYHLEYAGNIRSARQGIEYQKLYLDLMEGFNPDSEIKDEKWKMQDRLRALRENVNSDTGKLPHGHTEKSRSALLLAGETDEKIQEKIDQMKSDNPDIFPGHRKNQNPYTNKEVQERYRLFLTQKSTSPEVLKNRYELIKSIGLKENKFLKKELMMDLKNARDLYTQLLEKGTHDDAYCESKKRDLCRYMAALSCPAAWRALLEATEMAFKTESPQPHIFEDIDMTDCNFETEGAVLSNIKKVVQDQAGLMNVDIQDAGITDKAYETAFGILAKSGASADFKNWVSAQTNTNPPQSGLRAFRNPFQNRLREN